jgi:hypothetical protein
VRSLAYDEFVLEGAQVMTWPYSALELTLYKMSELGGEIWDSGVFGHGEFKNANSFEICATGGLQTGLKISKSGNFVRIVWKLGFGGFRIWRIQKWNPF